MSWSCFASPLVADREALRAPLLAKPPRPPRAAEPLPPRATGRDCTSDIVVFCGWLCGDVVWREFIGGSVIGLLEVRNGS